jgi:hypothetical protein
MHCALDESHINEDAGVLVCMTDFPGAAYVHFDPGICGMGRNL